MDTWIRYRQMSEVRDWFVQRIPEQVERRNGDDDGERNSGKQGRGDLVRFP